MQTTYSLFRRCENGNWNVRFKVAGKTIRRSCFSKIRAAAEDAAYCWLREYSRPTGQALNALQGGGRVRVS